MRWTISLALCSLLLAAPARADDAAVGLAPVGLILPLSAIGGVVTSIILAMDVADDQSVHPAFRNISLAFAGINVAAGAGGLIAGALVDEHQTVFYSVGGSLLGVGVVGGVLGLVVDTYTPSNEVAVVPLQGGGAAMLVGGTF